MGYPYSSVPYARTFKSSDTATEVREMPGKLPVSHALAPGQTHLVAPNLPALHVGQPTDTGADLTYHYYCQNCYAKIQQSPTLLPAQTLACKACQAATDFSDAT